MEELKKGSDKFKGEILNKVYKIWLTRKFLPIFILEIVILSGILYGLARAIFFKKVVENAMRLPLVNASSILDYFANAFVKTHTPTKLLIVALVVLTALLIRLLTQGILRWILVRKNYFGKSDPR